MKMSQMIAIHDIHEPDTGTWQYVVADPSTMSAAVIDSVLDFEPASATITTQSADKLLALIRSKGYQVELILETHAHADHLTAAAYLQDRLEKSQGTRPDIGIGKRIVEVQKRFGDRYGIKSAEYAKAFDRLLDDDAEFKIGNLTATVLHLPGHTPDHVGYKIQDDIFCGDSLFNADVGSARCDFPGGSATQLYDSVQRLLSHAPHVKIWTGHDYPPEARAGRAVSATTVGQQREQNKHLRDGTSRDDFVAWRAERDATLKEPRLIHYALQINIRAGRLPSPTAMGDRLVHVPLKIQSQF
ncbi:metallo-beta-lactamase domain protein [Metarhizium album ARSEF 1941]|uniref:Metallo-beta-lactamase domain protein n=1 Tax=Metarhizium album (strain ARSEF 1941) TaxID=1081103 RepID=A0A0B2WQK9_METAS|nr:metallo-beta-lactamase domain protein [Metarhizium album ARSEF 1941]KHN98346.1 metallo-beta-lactamase domain protein [Metarhizium album ARSEF 1941]